MSKRSVRFSIPDAGQKSSSDKQTYRKSKIPRISIKDDRPSSERISKARQSSASETTSVPSKKYSRTSRVTQMFKNTGLGNRSRSTIIQRPMQRFQPTYQLDSKKPFNPRAVEDLLPERVENFIKDKNPFDLKPDEITAMIRDLSEEILYAVKEKNYNRYKIIVSVMLGEKHFQGFHQCCTFLWDIEKDAMASYVCERANFFLIVNVYGFYYD